MKNTMPINPKKAGPPQFPTVQQQIDYWNTKERLEHERVNSLDTGAESPNERSETGDAFTPGPWATQRVSHRYGCYGHEIIPPYRGAMTMRSAPIAFINSDDDADRANARLIAAAPLLLKACKRSMPEIENCGDRDLVQFVESAISAASNPQEQISNTALTLDQTEATCDWFDSLADQEEARWSLREAGSNDGEGESYPARNV